MNNGSHCAYTRPYRPSSIWSVLFAAVPIFHAACTTYGAEASSESSRITELITRGKASCEIIYPNSDAISRRAAETLAGYLREHAGVTVPVIPETDVKRSSQSTMIVLDGTPDRALLRSAGITLEPAEDRLDAYRLRVLRQASRTIVAIAGRSPTGAKFGAYRLMEEMELGPGEASVSDLDISESPFFKSRLVSLFNVWRVPVEVIRHCNLESWPAEKIKQNVDMYDRMGFNAIETHDRFHEDFLKAVYGITREEWRNKVHAMCDRAHEHGMTMFLRQWGNSVALPVKKIEGGITPFGYVNLAPDIPEERRRWEIEIRDYITRNYAGHIDHLIGHWADAGGLHAGSKATIKDCMLLHNELQAAFRQINPKAETSFNLWFMKESQAPRKWTGYEDHRTLTSSGVLERDVIIAQATRAHNRPYDEQVTREILEDGYRAAVWTWRRGDTEVRLGDPGLRIRIHGVMGDYFRNLPESARQIEWHNIERNQHGISSDVNYYVASKLMWNPRSDVDAALKKYCALVFGKANADAAAEAFLAIEHGRDVENQVSAAILKNPVEGADRARRALKGLSQIKLSKSHRSRLPSVVTPQEMLKEMEDALRMIAENAELCSGPLKKLDALLEAGNMEEAKVLRDSLDKRAAALFGTIAGGMEGLWLKETLEARFEGAKATKTKPMSGFETSRINSIAAKDSAFVVIGQNAGVGTAVRQLDPPARRNAEFEFSFKVASEGASRNGGIAFGPGPSPEHLIRCMVYIGSQRLEIQGSGLWRSAFAVVPNLDFTRPIHAVATVNLDEDRVIFRVGEHSVEAPLHPAVREIGWYGYAVDKATTQFGAINVSRDK